jgi:hypothetical protein
MPNQPAKLMSGSFAPQPLTQVPVREASPLCTPLARIAHKFLDRPATLRPPASPREALRAWRSDAGCAYVNPDSEVKNRARARRRARSVGIVRRNKARMFSHHFVPLA